MTTACAPGKIILLGEHAVVYGRPAIAVPVRQVQACASVEPAGDGPAEGVFLVAPDRGLAAWLHDLAQDHPLAVICRLTLQALGASAFSPIRVTLLSTIPIASGLGSSAAVSVAIARALTEHFQGALPRSRISELAYEVERIHHGTPSGIDNTVVAFDRPVYFRRGTPPEPLEIGGSFTFLIGDTGRRAPTAEAVAGVGNRREAEPAFYDQIFDDIAELVEQALGALQAGRPDQLGPSMSANHALLARLRVSTPELNALVAAAEANGALGAKLSGGGLGGNMIALVTSDRADVVAEALRRDGAVQVLRTEVAP